MAVYVELARIPAQVGRIRARWSHLYADSPGFRAGLRQAARLWHYDVTESRRQAAIRAGARPVGLREFRAIIDRRDGVTSR